MAGCTNCACSHASKNESNGLGSLNEAVCAATTYSVREVGARNTLEYRSFVEDADGRVVSPFHDIALYPNPSDHSIVNFVIEIPRWSNAKLEISKEELMNPVKQDVKKGALRFVKNVFPYTGYPWNYGALPQTWEDPHEKDRETGYNGDNDPIDAIEVGGPVEPTGTVKVVKILGCLALIDEGETDWKIFVIDVKDPLARVVNDISDVETHFPGLIDATRSWFRSYKIPDGKPANSFAFDGAVRDRSFAIRVVEETATAWKRLICGKAEKDAISCVTRANRDSPYYIQPADEARIPTTPKEKASPAPVDPATTAWVYLKQ